jgi:hypothetical protein
MGESRAAAPAVRLARGVQVRSRHVAVADAASPSALRAMRR